MKSQLFIKLIFDKDTVHEFTKDEEYLSHESVCIVYLIQLKIYCF